MRREVFDTLYIAVRACDVPALARCVDANPDALHHVQVDGDTWLHTAVHFGCLDAVDYLIGRGVSVNAHTPPANTTPLDVALFLQDPAERTAMVRAVLARGADPNLGRPLISAINPRRGDETASLALIEALVEAGADVNRAYDVFGDPTNTFTALEFAEGYGRQRIVDYLVSRGAVRRTPPAK